MINRNSRYAGCILYRDSSGEYLGRRQRIDTTPRYDDRLHTVIAGDRIDLIAYRYLGDAKLWWIICDYIASMTDGFATRTYKRLFDPEFGSIVDLI